ncbi:MAG: tyrosine-type recombinase/integrase [Candidatus Hodarchaeota archaeon]
MRESIHDYDARLRAALDLLASSNISDANKKAILDFKQDCFSNGLSKGRVVKYVYYLIKLSKWLEKDFVSASLEDIKSLVLKIEESPYVDFSKKELKTTVKKLYKWLRQTDEYPPEVEWIRPGNKRIARMKLPEELLTEDEIKAMVRASQKERDRGLVATLYESGCRIGELLFLKLRHISFDEYGAQILVEGKTGTRRIRLISSVPYLHEWLNKHPYPENSDSFVWSTSNGKALSYNRASYILSSLGKRAGIRKKIYPHLFRHSRATYLANHLTEAQMKEVFGWVQASDMAAIYVHLSGRDVDNALLRVYGIDKDETRKESTLKPQVCERCHGQNSYSNTFCSKCGYALDESTKLGIIKNEMEREKADNVLDELIKDKHFRDLFITKLQGLEMGRT